VQWNADLRGAGEWSLPAGPSVQRQRGVHLRAAHADGGVRDSQLRECVQRVQWNADLRGAGEWSLPAGPSMRHQRHLRLRAANDGAGLHGGRERLRFGV